jgi:hypothetical protein
LFSSFEDALLTMSTKQPSRPHRENVIEADCWRSPVRGANQDSPPTVAS